MIPGVKSWHRSESAAFPCRYIASAKDLPYNELTVYFRQPGGFATAVAQSSNLKIGSHNISGYDGAHDWVKGFNLSAGKEPGDARKGAQRVIQLIQQKELPTRFALGVCCSDWFHQQNRVGG